MSENSSELPVKPTKETYERLQQFYEYLNRHLFDSELPGCLLTLQRKKRSYGFFSSNRFTRQDGQSTDEIALNPAHFRDRPLHEILATLAHEMVHQWQHHYGKSGRGPYHNRQWADQMKKVGLQPTATGEEGGKETGDRVHHLIVPGGPFDKVVSRLTAKGYDITWTEVPRTSPAPAPAPEEDGAEENTKSGQRLKYVCTHEGCKENLRGRSGQRPLCQGNTQSEAFHAPAPMVAET